MERTAQGPFWQVSHTVITKAGRSTHSPTFYLHGNVLGITNAEQAARIVCDMAARIAPAGSRIIGRAVDARDGSAYNVNTNNSAECERPA